MELDARQKEAVRKWVAEGCNIAEIQKRLDTEFGLSMTYLDVRFLLIDMRLEIKEKKTSNKIIPEIHDKKNSEPSKYTLSPQRVNVQLDRITKPGYLASGTVSFSDGTKGQWAIDQFGRVMLETAIAGYRPSAEDMTEFQSALKQLLEGQSI